MFALILIESLSTDYLDYCACYAEVDVDVLVVSAWFVCFGVNAVIIEFASSYQNFFNVRNLNTSFGLISSIQKIGVVRIALQDT